MRGEGPVPRAAASPHHTPGLLSLWTGYIFVSFLCLELFAVLPNTRNVKSGYLGTNNELFELFLVMCLISSLIKAEFLC